MISKSTVFHFNTPLIYVQHRECQKRRVQGKWSGPQCQMLPRGQGKRVKLEVAPSTAPTQDTTTHQSLPVVSSKNKRISHPLIKQRTGISPGRTQLEIPPLNLVVSKSQKCLLYTLKSSTKCKWKTRINKKKVLVKGQRIIRVYEKVNGTRVEMLNTVSSIPVCSTQINWY